MLAITNASPTIHPSPIRWQPVPSEQFERIKNVALGALVFLIELPIMDWLVRKVIDLMYLFNFDLSDGHKVVQLWDAAENLSHSFLNLAFKTAVLIYTVILGPVLEEWLFRDVLHNQLRTWFKNPDSPCNRIARIVGNGLIFGTVHLSPFRGWSNAPVFLVSFLLGTVFAALRETTGNRTASTTAHILHNADAMRYFLCEG